MLQGQSQGDGRMDRGTYDMGSPNRGQGIVPNSVKLELPFPQLNDLPRKTSVSQPPMKYLLFFLTPAGKFWELSPPVVCLIFSSILGMVIPWLIRYKGRRDGTLVDTYADSRFFFKSSNFNPR